jgi:hypothetical protein
VNGKRTAYPEGRGPRSPWGPAQVTYQIASGVVFYSTSSHGGFKVEDEQNENIPPEYRRMDGWYEEDCEAALVVLYVPGEAFTTKERQEAARTVAQWFPPCVVCGKVADWTKFCSPACKTKATAAQGVTS